MTALTPSVGAQHARILSVGDYRPSRVVPNDELVERIDSSDQWIRERTGIVERRWAGPDETLVEMAVQASAKAIAAAGIGPERIGAVVLATISHMVQTPAAAADVAHRLGASGAAAFDLSAACAGFCYGLGLASDMVRGGSAEHVLVIGVERLTDITNFDDRGTAFLFGDGAGAVVVGPSGEPGIGPTVWGSDGAQLDAIEMTAPWNSVRDDPDAAFPTLRMAGQQVFRWAVYSMAPVALKAIEAAGITPDQLDAFIPHQANNRITDAMIKTLKLPEHVAVARDIVTTGNTSAASVPLAMARMLESGQARSGDTALLIGFGAGLAYAAQVVVLP